MGEDTGHDALMLDLGGIVKQAEAFAFHDFKNDVYPAPKMALVNLLQEVIENVKQGKYDN